MTTHEPPLRVVIVGGGFTGAAVAWQLARMQVPARITIIEPRADLGQGLAYSATDPAHRINVPAHRMGLDPDNRADFAEWLAKAEKAGEIAPDPTAPTPRGGLFPRRSLFGRYVTARLAPHRASGAIRHIRARVGDAERAPDGGLVLHLSDDSRLRADLVVLANGHPAPALPKVLAGLTGSPQLIGDVADAAGLAQVPRDARVLILGAGLSSADAIATLDRQGFQGRITCLSRHGLRSRGQGEIGTESEVDFTEAALRGTSDLLRRVRRAIADDQARGQSWHAVLSRLRAQGPQIWAALEPAAQARLLRHLRTHWDVHRYRVAPQAEQVIDRLLAQSRLAYAAGHLVSARGLDDGRIQVGWRQRGTDQIVGQRVDRVIVTTGPAQGRCIHANPALGALARLGLIAPDPHGLGLATAGGCKAVDAQGRESDRILIAGPLARGHMGELVGAPECAAHARDIAREIARRARLAPILRPPAFALRAATPS